MTPTDGSCRTRRSITPTFVASWNFSAASPLNFGVQRLLLLAASFLISGRMTSNGSWVLFPSAIRTTAFILQPTIVPSIVGLLLWKLPSGPSPTICPTVQYHGATIRAILHALHLSTTLSRRSRSSKYEARAPHPKPSELSGPTNLLMPFGFCGHYHPLTASTSTPWYVCGNTA